MLAASDRIVRLPPKPMAHSRDLARTNGKSDPIDALAVARPRCANRTCRPQISTTNPESLGCWSITEKT
jgi:hypothetical protein